MHRSERRSRPLAGRPPRAVDRPPEGQQAITPAPEGQTGQPGDTSVSPPILTSRVNQRARERPRRGGIREGILMQPPDCRWGGPPQSIGRTNLKSLTVGDPEGQGGAPYHPPPSLNHLPPFSLCLPYHLPPYLPHTSTPPPSPPMLTLPPLSTSPNQCLPAPSFHLPQHRPKHLLCPTPCHIVPTFVPTSPDVIPTSLLPSSTSPALHTRHNSWQPGFSLPAGS